MPRKILLSFLGTNNYLECNYFIEGQPDRKVENVKYIQEALVRLFCKDFTSEDQVLLFLTEKAEKINFWDNGQKNPENQEFKNIGLKRRLEKFLQEDFSFEITHKPIKDGFSQEEIWSIFETVADQIEEGDQIIFDITHAFRFLPMLGVVLLNYLKVTKNIKVLGIHYGAFEKLGSFQEVSILDMEHRNAPILDLNTLLEFQSWTSAVYSFIKFGETKELNEASQSKIKSKMAESRGSDLATKDLRYVIDQLSELTSNLQTNRLSSLLSSDFTLFKEKLVNVQETEMVVKPFKQIIKLVEKKVTPIITSNELIWLESAKWCLEHKLLQQAYTQLQEGILTFCMNEISIQIGLNDSIKSIFQKHNLDPKIDIKNKDQRKYFASLIYFVYKSSQALIKETDPKNLVEPAKVIASTSSRSFLQLCDYFGQINKPRNDINHAGMTEETMSPKSLGKKIEELISKIEGILK